MQGGQQVCVWGGGCTWREWKPGLPGLFSSAMLVSTWEGGQRFCMCVRQIIEGKQKVVVGSLLGDGRKLNKAQSVASI